MTNPPDRKPRLSSRQENAPQYSDFGIVLRSYKLGEADKILRIMTRENGKISAVGKGVRRTRSKFGARLEPFTCLKLFIHKGKTLDIISQAEIETSFHQIRENLELFVCASAMAELVDSVLEEKQKDSGLFDLLYKYLTVLEKSPDKAALVQAGFEFKIMARAGYELNTGSCATCSSVKGKDCPYFSIRLGGLICDKCRKERSAQTGKLVKLSSECVELMILMTSGPENKWLEDPQNTKAQKEMRYLMDKVLEHWMERDFKSHRVLKSIPGV
ncbi:MAG: DNA repair protein RecO [Actinobacteria bacterium]|nr:DNA repair protein RecO [Actinomycetota bacterium]